MRSVFCAPAGTISARTASSETITRSIHLLHHCRRGDASRADARSQPSSCGTIRCGKITRSANVSQAGTFADLLGSCRNPVLSRHYPAVLKRSCGARRFQLENEMHKGTMRSLLVGFV